MTAIRRIRAWWFDTAKQARWTTYVCIPIGVAGLLSGVYGDSHHGWDDRAFLTNLISSLTSLMFGVPTALLIITHLGNYQTEALEKRQVARRVRAELEVLEQALLQNLGPDSVLYVRQRLAALKRTTLAILDHLPPEGEAMTESLFESQVTHVRICQHILERLFSDRDREKFNKWMNEIQAQWKVLDEDVRPSVANTGNPWITLAKGSEARNALPTIQESGILRDPEVITDRRSGIRPHMERLNWIEAFEALLSAHHELLRLYR
ncbi:hypothetical protein [Streptomyces aureus]|uniref:Uncharacterized protein n=1 Tax=Streptomyces aureus TaxID=193461 RepID=A0ABV4SM61_9ACTN